MILGGLLMVEFEVDLRITHKTLESWLERPTSMDFGSITIDKKEVSPTELNESLLDYVYPKVNGELKAMVDSGDKLSFEIVDKSFIPRGQASEFRSNEPYDLCLTIAVSSVKDESTKITIEVTENRLTHLLFTI